MMMTMAMAMTMTMTMTMTMCSSFIFFAMIRLNWSGIGLTRFINFDKFCRARVSKQTIVRYRTAYVTSADHRAIIRPAFVILPANWATVIISRRSRSTEQLPGECLINRMSIVYCLHTCTSRTGRLPKTPASARSAGRSFNCKMRAALYTSMTRVRHPLQDQASSRHSLLALLKQPARDLMMIRKSTYHRALIHADMRLSLSGYRKRCALPVPICYQNSPTRSAADHRSARTERLFFHLDQSSWPNPSEEELKGISLTSSRDGSQNGEAESPVSIQIHSAPGSVLIQRNIWPLLFRARLMKAISRQ